MAKAKFERTKPHCNIGTIGPFMEKVLDDTTVSYYFIVFFMALLKATIILLRFCVSFYLWRL